MTDNSYRHILKYTSIFGSVQGLGILVGLVRNKAIALLLGPTGMGIASIYNTTVAFLTEATNLGIPTSAVRDVSAAYEQESSTDVGITSNTLEKHIAAVRAWTIVAAILGTLATLILGPVLSEGSFNYGDHTLNYIMLAPAVALTTIVAGETAIMKGARCLKALVWTQIAFMIASLIIAIPIYYVFSYRGVLPVILLTAITQAVITLSYSLRQHPLHLCGFRSLLQHGRPMLTLGLAFVFTGILGKGAELFIRFFLNMDGGEAVVGLYNAGYMIAVSYAGMVFTAMETDYYPRLSGCGDDYAHIRNLVNKQIEITTLLASPMLLTLMVSLPIVMPLLFSDKFLPIVPMAQIAVLAMYAKAVTLPAAYIALARSHWRIFIILEALYAICMCVTVPIGFRIGDLYGTGIAIVVAHIFDLIIVWTYAIIKYHCTLSAKALRHILIQVIIATLSYSVIIGVSGIVCIALCAIMTISSAAYSLKHLLSMRHKNS